jgi:hypothetical protein
MRRLALPLLSALLLASCQASSEPVRPPPPPPAATGTLAVHGVSGSAGALRLGDLARFAIDATYQGEPGVHALRVDVLTPRGQLYAQLAGTLDAGAGGAGAASLGLEVAGTPIESYRMTGTWQFILSVDGGAALASTSVAVVD